MPKSLQMAPQMLTFPPVEVGYLLGPEEGTLSFLNSKLWSHIWRHRSSSHSHSAKTVPVKAGDHDQIKQIGSYHLQEAETQSRGHQNKSPPHLDCA